MVRDGVAMQSIRYPNLQIKQTNDGDEEEISCYKYASSSDDESDSEWYFLHYITCDF